MRVSRQSARVKAMSNNPLYSSNGVPLYGKLGRPIYGDFIFSPEYIYIGARMPIVATSDYGELSLWVFCNAAGYNYTRGIYYSTPPIFGAEKDSMSVWEFPPLEAMSNTTEWYWYRFNYDAMVANGFGLGNDGTNDYYEIFCRASLNTLDYRFPPDPTYVNFEVWKDTQHRVATPILMSVIDYNSRHASETPLASVRWTPATSTLEFIYL